MSTLPNQANLSPSWKQEVNQRVAAHKDRRTSSIAELEADSATHRSASSRAAAAAARVAARYANVPSYSEILAGEARAAVRAAEAATRAAIEAQAAAESVLDELEAASAAEPTWELTPFPAGFLAEAVEQQESAEAGQGNDLAGGMAPHGEGFEIRWERDLPVRPVEDEAGYTMHGATPQETPESSRVNGMGSAWVGRDGHGGEAIETVEPAEAIHANLIEFPREIVATRRVRPRLADGPWAATGGQLSIFEVDPSTISMEPAAAVAGDGASLPAWTGPEWSGIELDAQPRREYLEPAPAESVAQPARMDQALDGVSHLEQAPMSLRLMAAIVNGSLVTAVFLAVAGIGAANAKALPSLRVSEVYASLGLATLGALYLLLFHYFSKGTPGMRYAGISLCTLDGQTPTRTQRCKRLGALLLSVLPVGLGIVWAIFDEDHLSWHDRLSQTYLRKY